LLRHLAFLFFDRTSKKRGTASWIMGLTGTLFICIAVVQFIFFQIGLLNGHPFSSGIAASIISVAAVGVLGSLASYCFQKTEDRLDKLEHGERDRGNV
jgi:hypothetical protein